MEISRRDLLKLGLVALLGAGMGGRAMAKTRSGVVLVGIDGLDPRICEEMMRQGELPALAALAREGGFSPMATVFPPQSPVAWASMGLSANPGKHGVFDFLRRDPDNYGLELGVLRRNRRNLFGSGDSMFLPVLDTGMFWENIARNGQNATVLRWPMQFPPDKGKARVLAGLGVPDVAGGLGRCSFFTDDPELATAGGKGHVALVQLRDGQAETELPGPRYSRFGKVATATQTLRLRVLPGQNTLELDLGGEVHQAAVGRFSPWFHPEFSTGMLSSVRGLCRMYPLSLNPLRLYCSPVELDPAEPCFPISAPRSWSRELAERHGDFHTLGMAEDANAVSDGHLDEQGFLLQCEELLQEREAMFQAELDDFQGGFLANVFFSPDRIQHVFWATRDPKHPAHDPTWAAQWAHVIPDLYRRLDTIVGQAATKARKQNADLMVVSDHGFCSFRHAVHLNRLLVDAGLMRLTQEPDPADPDAAPLFKNVDWSNTQAYALGFNQIFLNLENREQHGIVRPGQETEETTNRIIQALNTLRGPDNNPAISRALRANELYTGPKLPQAPDIVVGFHPNYRASWQTALGGVPAAPILEPNLKKWTGDHLVDPTAVPATLFTSFPQSNPTPTILDIAPTILTLLGLPTPPDWEGNSLV